MYATEATAQTAVLRPFSQRYDRVAEERPGVRTSFWTTRERLVRRFGQPAEIPSGVWNMTHCSNVYRGCHRPAGVDLSAGMLERRSYGSR